MSNRLGGKTLVYFGLYDASEVPGVHQKVTGVLTAAEARGYATRLWAEPFSKTAPLRRLADAIASAPESHLILRSAGFANLFLVPAMLRARRNGKHITIDVPSPHSVAVREIWGSTQSWWRRLRAVIAFYLSGPWSLWPASRIVQYAPEGWFYRLGNTSRTVEIGNGIDVHAIRPRAVAPPWPAPRLEVVAVAGVARWHGFDRLLRAVRDYQDRPGRTHDVHLTIAGDGPSLPQLRSLCADLDLERHVTLTGLVTGDALRAIYASAHLGVSSVGLHRIGLDRASVLKAREYCAIGLPFIASGHDPDFPQELPFRLVASADESTADLVRLFADFGTLHARLDPAAQRRYAEAHLDWRHKVDAFGLVP